MSEGGATMPPLVRAIDRAQRIANGLAGLGDQLHAQANRVIGNNATEPSSPVTGAAQTKPEGGPLLARLEEALQTIERNLNRANDGATRLSEIG